MLARPHDLDRVLGEITGREDCRILPAAGQPQLRNGLILPDDVRRFHERCGGVVILQGSDFPWHVGVPDRMSPAGPRFLTAELAAQIAVEYSTDLTNSCYVIADGGRESSTDPHIVIDLDPSRLGRCYVAFWDTYGLAGEMPIVALTVAELLSTLLDHDGQTAALPDRYGDAYEPRLPPLPEPTREVDSHWLSRWRDDMTEAVASAMSTFETRMGYPPGDNRVAVPLSAGRLAEIDATLPRLPPDLAMLCRFLGGTSLPDIGNGWFVLSPLYQARVGPPYNVDIILFAADGGDTSYAIPVGEAGPVLRLREVGETAPGVFDGHRVDVSQPHLAAFLSRLRDAVRLFARNGGITDL